MLKLSDDTLKFVIQRLSTATTVRQLVYTCFRLHHLLVHDAKAHQVPTIFATLCAHGDVYAAQHMRALYPKVVDCDDGVCPALSNGHTAVVRWLQHDDTYLARLNHGGFCVDLLIAVQRAMAKRHYDTVACFLHDRHFNPALHDNALLRFACRTNHPRIVAQLLKDKRVDARARENEAIIQACERGCADVVRLLLTNGHADPNAKHGDPLRLACRYGRVEVVKLLLSDRRINTHMRAGVPLSYHRMPLRLACQHHHVTLAELLIAHGSDPSVIDNMLFREACIKGDYAIAQVLLRHPRVCRFKPQIFDMILTRLEPKHQWLPFLDRLPHDMKQNSIMRELLEYPDMKDYWQTLVRDELATWLHMLLPIE